MDPFLAEIRIFAGNFAPRGWAFCNGQLMSISQNTALFSLLGTTYGGDGKSTFGLPNLQGSVPIQQGQGSLRSWLRRGASRFPFQSSHTV
jgi:microcystin-dependent protein